MRGAGLDGYKEKQDAPRRDSSSQTRRGLHLAFSHGSSAPPSVGAVRARYLHVSQASHRGLPRDLRCDDAEVSLLAVGFGDPIDQREIRVGTQDPKRRRSIYTTHTPIIAPKVHVAAYLNKRHTDRNQKTSYSITVQGVVNADGIFTDVCIGNPGSLADDQILDKSSLSQQRAARGLLRDGWIVGNAGFPLTDYLLVPYARQNLTWTQHGFNENIGGIQKVATEAFERLKGRWACLQKRTEVKLQDLPFVLGACCVLHNICEMRKEEMAPELKFEVVDDVTVPENSIRSTAASSRRDQISHNLLHRILAGTRAL